MTNYLITGGAGFLGRHLVKRLSQNRDNHIIIYDNFYRSSLEILSESLENTWELDLEIIIGDIKNSDLLKYCMRNTDIVFHLAAQSNVVGAEDNSDYSISTNVLGTYTVLEAAKTSCVKKVVFTSSREVYGDPEYFPVDENHVLNPKNFYGTSKVAGELYCKLFREKYGMDISILRLANVYGKGDFGRVIPDWIKKLNNNEKINVYGGEQILDFVDIDTVVDSLIAVSEKNVETPINIGSGTGTSILRLAQVFEEIYDKKDIINLLPARNFEVKGYVANTYRMQKDLGIIPNSDPLHKLPELIGG